MVGDSTYYFLCSMKKKIEEGSSLGQDNLYLTIADVKVHRYLMVVTLSVTVRLIWT